MIAKKNSDKFASLTVHSKEVALMLFAINQLPTSVITENFGKELISIEDTLKMLLDEMDI